MNPDENVAIVRANVIQDAAAASNGQQSSVAVIKDSVAPTAEAVAGCQ